MKRALALCGLLMVASSCDCQTDSASTSDLSTETLNDYMSPAASAESPANRSDSTRSWAEAATDRAESAASRADESVVLPPLVDSTIVDSTEQVRTTTTADANSEQWTKVISGYDFLHFSAAWCPACKLQEPVLKKLREAGYRVRIVDIDVHPELAKLFRIPSIPAYVAAADGQVVLDKDGRPKIRHGMAPTANPNSWRVDPQAVLHLLENERTSPSSTPSRQSHTQAELKQIAAGHNWRAAPAYVRFVGNRSRRDYLDHLEDDHGLSAEELKEWTTTELFQLHSALHCPNCREKLKR